MKYPYLIVGVVFLLTASVGFTQGVVATTAGGHINTTAFMSPGFLPPAVTGAPYSGEETQEHTQTLSDGTHITQPMMRRVMYRDSLGRTRVERPLMMGPQRASANAPQAPTVIEITDPEAGVQYTLDTQAKIAHRSTVQSQNLPIAGRAGNFVQMAPASRVAVATLSGGAPSPTAPNVVSGVSGPAFRPQFSTEKLGTQVIEGVLAEGERTTTTIPEGEQGNDRPIVTSAEIWTSPELKMVVLQKFNDPRSGESILKMSNLSRSEPDASLFQPPPDYTVVEETGQFAIHFSN